MNSQRLLALTLFSFAMVPKGPARAAPSERSVHIRKVASEPERAKGATGDLAELRKAATENPKDRHARFRLVQGLMAAGELEEAKKTAIEWREADAYNLVVVRLLGDIYSQMGESEKAMRTYSAVVELLPKDHKAQRALASVLKQSGQLRPAMDRLRAALVLRPDDARLRFEMADVLQRVGEDQESQELFEEIVSNEETPDLLRYPAKERLAQNYQGKRAAALQSGKVEEADTWLEKIKTLSLQGGIENDIKVFLTWDTDRSDVDLWVVNPAGEKVFYSHKKGRFGGRLFGDVTNGYGPESFTAHNAKAGEYKIQVNYYGVGSQNFPEARGEVTILTNEGKANESREVLPYRLFNKGQTVTIAKVTVR